MAKILIIDDDIELSSMVQEWFVEASHFAVVKHNGTDGLKELKQGDYDLVVCDWHMPDMEGIDVLRQFRSFNSATPVLRVTLKSCGLTD